jgi:hypothetical protein
MGTLLRGFYWDCPLRNALSRLTSTSRLWTRTDSSLAKWTKPGKNFQDVASESYYIETAMVSICSLMTFSWPVLAAKPGCNYERNRCTKFYLLRRCSSLKAKENHQN